MFCGGWGGGGGNVREARSHREVCKSGFKLSVCRCCRLTCAGFLGRRDVGQSLGLPEQLGVVNDKHQDRSIVSRIVIQTYLLCNGLAQLLMSNKYTNNSIFGMVDGK